MKLIQTALPEVVIVEPAVFGDDRGWFMESFNDARFGKELAALGLPAPGAFVQDNQSSSKRGVLRGLHYQLPPHPQGKLVRVVAGAALDVAVDIRRGSPRFGRWVAVEISAANHRQLWLPPGFAHGFVALEDDTHFLYKTTDYYAKDCERAIAWSDADLGVAWPDIAGGLLVSDKDKAASSLKAAEVFEFQP